MVSGYQAHRHPGALPTGRQVRPPQAPVQTSPTPGLPAGRQARTPEYVIQKIVDLRISTGWCGQKIRQELRENHDIHLGLATIYRWLHARMHAAVVGVRKYSKHQAMVTASAPRQVVEHDTVDLGELYAYTALDIFTKEPSVFIGTDLEMETGARGFAHHHAYYGDTELHQSDNGSEFRADFVAAVEDSGATHRYARPYKKNEQACLPAGRPTSRTSTRPCGVSAWATPTTPSAN